MSLYAEEVMFGDVRTPTLLGPVLPKCPGGDNNGFDHNFVLANTEGELNFACRVEHPPSGEDGVKVQSYKGVCGRSVAGVLHRPARGPVLHWQLCPH